MVILSPTSVASENVMDEVGFALEEKKRIFPVLYRRCKIPFRIRRIQRSDFTDIVYFVFFNFLYLIRL
ncbi:hypothetical protein GWN42_06400 [candidate division KSB1 bacterium]|nr:hypothetical protein [candidate division KSB1 bacterium]